MKVSWFKYWENEAVAESQGRGLTMMASTFPLPHFREVTFNKMMLIFGYLEVMET